MLFLPFFCREKSNLSSKKLSRSVGRILFPIVAGISVSLGFKTTQMSSWMTIKFEDFSSCFKNHDVIFGALDSSSLAKLLRISIY
jgi:hypothetical protein